MTHVSKIIWKTILWFTVYTTSKRLPKHLNLAMQVCSMPDLQNVFSPLHLSCRTTPRVIPNSSSPKSNLTCQETGRKGIEGPNSPRRGTYPLASPSRRRRSNLHMDCEIDSWAQFKRRSSTNPLSTNSLVLNGHRLRRFSVTPKWIVNSGDPVRNRSSSDVEPYHRSCSDASDYLSSASSSRRSSNSPLYRVGIIGGENVGKTSLIYNFVNSDYLTGCESYQVNTEYDVEGSVSVLMDDHETDLIFESISSSEVTVDDTMFSFTDAFLVLYSMTDRQSFEDAGRTLALLRYLGTKLNKDIMGPDAFPKALILVGNKCDLVRSRAVTEEEGRILANKYNIKFIETSTEISHNVDELLVGIISQIRLRSRVTIDDSPIYKSRCLSGKARGLMSKFLFKCELKVRSCDNLYVL
ncbi:GTP-binding protein REM 1-like [Tachypleus tridentatus]|uniref:GTP-binding protein REM 1-like n=1 Tax=Tachypleus tridentatus TaxID=6853 RepID=UPI003FD3A721